MKDLLALKQKHSLSRIQSTNWSIDLERNLKYYLKYNLRHKKERTG